MKFEGAACRLRPLRRSDASKTILWRNDPETRALVLGYPFPITEEMETAWYDTALADQSTKSVRFAIEPLASADLIGMISLTSIDWICRSATLGVVIGADERRGQGIGLDAVRLVVDYAFGTLNLQRISITVAAANLRAVHLYEKCGFAEEGRHARAAYIEGRLIDLISMSLLREIKGPASP